MTNAQTDNSVSSQNVVLWQYDKAANFCALVTLVENLGQEATEAFWNYFLNNVDDLDNADDFGLSVWGILIGVQRPQLSHGGITIAMSTELYRRVIKARVKLLLTNGSLASISEYAADIFGVNIVQIVDNNDMSIDYAIRSGATMSDETWTKKKPDGTIVTVTITGAEKTALYNAGDYWKFYPAGVRDNAAPATRFVSFKKQYETDLAAQGSVASTTTKPNFFSGVLGGVDFKGVFHPKERHWTFYDADGELLTTAYTMTYTAGTGRNNGTWRLSDGTTTESQTGRDKTVWRDYGVYFPTAGVMAVWC